MHDTRQPVDPASSRRGFWWIFGGAWLAYLGLFLSALVVEGEPTKGSILFALAAFGPPAGLSFIVAARRRDLLRPERSLRHTVLVHVGVGLTYAIAAAGSTAGVLALVRVLGGPSVYSGPAVGAAAWVINDLLLYVILAGFLMWTESMARVQESRTLAAREGMLRAQAEADALRARFNPHFVFNTLHSLILLVHAEPATAERAIEDVAALIRYASTLQRKGLDLVPLGQEIEVARRYMALEKLRLGDRLTVEWGEIEGVQAFGVPPLSLQILLENAVKHGISTLTEGGTVHVSASRTADCLELTVEDNGAGAEADTPAGSEGRGLGLLGRRLDSLFGPAASLEWETAPGQGFRVTMRVPRTAPPEVDVPGLDSAPLPAYRSGP